METTIDVTPTWDSATRIYLEVLRVNDWEREPSKMARKEILRLANAFDSISKFVREEWEKNNDSIK